VKRDLSGKELSQTVSAPMLTEAQNKESETLLTEKQGDETSKSPNSDSKKG
jgi:hypothetical protein